MCVSVWQCQGIVEGKEKKKKTKTEEGGRAPGRPWERDLPVNGVKLCVIQAPVMGGGGGGGGSGQEGKRMESGWGVGEACWEGEACGEGCSGRGGGGEAGKGW